MIALPGTAFGLASDESEPLPAEVPFAREKLSGIRELDALGARGDVSRPVIASAVYMLCLKMLGLAELTLCCTEDWSTVSCERLM